MILFTFIVGLLCCQVQAWSPPRLKVNNEDLIESDMVIDAGSRLVLTCEGDGPVTIVPQLAKHKKYSKANGTRCNFTVSKTASEFTGTYKCVYTGINSSNFSSVYIFIRNSKTLFKTPSDRSIIKKEGEEALVPCLLTDPAATDVQFRMENGSAPPPDMDITFDPKKGMLIRSLQLWFSSNYVCSAKIGGVEKKSPAFRLQVTYRARFPLHMTLESNEYIRLVGERLMIICSTSNRNINFNITWKHSSHLLPKPKNELKWKNDVAEIKSTLILPAVTMSDSGNITCIGANDAGVSSSTTSLLVIDEPYIRLSPKLSLHLIHKDWSIDVHEGQDVALRVTIEAYPQITHKQWEGPTFLNKSQHEIRFFSNNNRYETVLLLRRLNYKEQGRYTFYTNSSKAHASITFSIHVYEKPVIVDKRRNGSSLICTASGYPTPEILWFQCQGTRSTCTENSTDVEPHQLITSKSIVVKNDKFEPVEVESFVTITPSDQKMTVECVAQNLVGQDSDTFPIDQSEKLFTATLTGAITVMLFLLLLLLILMYKYKQKPKYEIRWKIIEATDGNSYTFIDPTQLPYNEKWEFPRDKLKLGKVLGSGAFGKVVEATAYGLGKEDNVTRVAVKMLKASAHSDEKEALMSELKILSHLGQHKHIVNLLGACTHGGPVLVITEYCCHGDLLNFLRNKAQTFLNCMISIPEERSNYKNVNNDKMFFRSDSGISSICSDSYLDMKPLVPRSQTARLPSCSEDGESLDMDNLLRFSYQVAQGLEFLAAKNCIHRDVAARNVLLTDGGMAKICDFGLARDIMNDSNYVVKGNARLPVKWMAPESIFECVYTVQSDVWSYGILLWEIFSLGKSPYPNILVDSKFYKMIKCGYQMNRPDFAPPEMYTIMKTCWNLEPTERPTFSKIAQLIERLLGETPDQTQYQNVQTEELDEEQLEACDPTKSDEESCEQEADEQPLMKANNYQFC
ncbi:macrophage colony-stimulating factor 1 receptor-like isoform X2 [Neoarius graeffei]|uniref:macrophage colony-stimulating factor 1 receptor-like isoform X2 n=1 Tax=Neoarius graeffei TaxID=443677 RepID=UPI00298BF489|nr:macrophage colony-stimulating factor 1 receptor-like isoform X2 [Neoarius graeffei]